MKTTPSMLSVLLLSALSTHANADECGKITIADMNWNSASLMAHIDQFVLNEGYQCDAELIPGDSVPTGTSMIEKGQPDVAPELWTNGIKEALDKGIADKRLRIASESLVNGGEEGFWVPAYLVKQYPELATIEASSSTPNYLNTQRMMTSSRFIAALLVGHAKSPPVTCLMH